MSDWDILFALALTFWPLIVALAIVISLFVKMIHDEIEYRKWAKSESDS